MYRIIKIDGTELGITDSVNYIRYGDGGCFTTATRKDAIGVPLSAYPNPTLCGERYSFKPKDTPYLNR